MSNHQVGNIQQAKMWYAKALAQINPQDGKDDKSNIIWQDRICQQVLFHEAEQLVGKLTVEPAKK